MSAASDSVRRQSMRRAPCWTIAISNVAWLRGTTRRRSSDGRGKSTGKERRSSSVDTICGATRPPGDVESLPGAGGRRALRRSPLVEVEAIGADAEPLPGERDDEQTLACHQEPPHPLRSGWRLDAVGAEHYVDLHGSPRRAVPRLIHPLVEPWSGVGCPGKGPGGHSPARVSRLGTFEGELLHESLPEDGFHPLQRRPAGPQRTSHGRAPRLKTRDWRRADGARPCRTAESGIT